MSKLMCSLLLAFLLLNSFVSPNADKRIGFYELKRGNFSVKLTNLGATILSLKVPDKNGKIDDIVLGYGDFKDYLNDTTYFGALVGRVANRIGGAKFTLDGVTYKLAANDGKNCLHGGNKGYSHNIWKLKSYKKDSHITFAYDSFDGEQGFPGDLLVEVTYMFIGTDKWGIKMMAWPKNKATPVNLAQHTYWNLRGQGSGTILSQKIQLFASKITPVNGELIPTGEIVPINGTPYDFLYPHEIGSKINEIPSTADQDHGGYDTNYVLDVNDKNHLNKVAIAEDSVSGRKMELWTNQHAVQFYSGNFLHDAKGKDGVIYGKHDGFCLETQGFPNAVNQPNFPSQIVYPGQTYEHIMLYRFTAHKT